MTMLTDRAGCIILNPEYGIDIISWCVPSNSSNYSAQRIFGVSSLFQEMV